MANRWTVPEIVHQPDIMQDDEATGSWDDFRKLVNRNCGAYLRGQGADDMRAIMSRSTLVDKAKREVAKVRNQREIDEFFETLAKPLPMVRDRWQKGHDDEQESVAGQGEAHHREGAARDPGAVGAGDSSSPA